MGARAGNTKLHYFYGKMLLEYAAGSNDEILYHFERGYTPGDSNYEAQFLHARQLFVMGRLTDSKAMFRRLGALRIGREAKNALRYPLDTPFYGTVSRIEASYCLISRDGDAEWIFGSRTDISPEIWNRLSHGVRVTFRIAFSMTGSRALDVTVQ